MCTCLCCTWSLIRGGLEYLWNKKAVEQGTHHAAALSTVTGHSICPDRATEQEEEKEEVFLCVCVCVWLCERICVGLCQEMAELSGMRCLLHSLAVGVSIMRVTEGCLCVGEFFSAFRVCICTVCVCEHK